MAWIENNVAHNNSHYEHNVSFGELLWPTLTRLFSAALRAATAKSKTPKEYIQYSMDEN